MPHVQKLAFVTLAVVPLVLAACSPGFKALDKAPPAARMPSGANGSEGVPKVSCDDVVTDAKINDFINQPGAAGLSAIRGGTPVSCSGTGGEADSVGYSEIFVTPAISLTPQTSFSPDADSFRGEIRLAVGTLDGDQLATIGETFKNSKGERPNVTVQLPDFESVVLGDLPEVRFQVVKSDDQSANVLRFTVSQALNKIFQDRLQGYQAGSQALTFFLGADYDHAALKTVSAKVGENLRLNTFSSVAAADYLSSLWDRVATTDGAAADNQTAFVWMQHATLWMPKLKLPAGDARQRFAAPLSLANDLWAGAGAKTDAAGPSSSLRALRFLTVTDSTSPAAATYGLPLQKIEAALKLEDAALYDALLEITLRNHYSPAQQNAMILAAGKAGPYSSTQAQAWQEGKFIATQTNFDLSRINILFDAAEWLRVNQPDYAYEHAKTWIIEKGVDAGRLASLKGLDAALVKYFDPGAAAQKSIDLVVGRNLSKPQADAYLSVINALAPTVGGDAALSKADDYFNEKKLSAEQVTALTATVQWLQTTSYKDEAVQRAEDYVINRKIDPSDVLRMKRIWTWLQDTSFNQQALDKAEEWVITRKLSPDQTDAIKTAYDWLAYTPKWAPTPLPKAEDYVVNHGAGLDQILQMKELDSWLSSSPVGASSVDRAEEYVLKRHLPKEKTDLLGIAYLFVRDTPAKAKAVERAEDYVFNRGLTPDMLTRLRSSYQDKVTNGDAQALQDAEHEVFGGF